MITNLYTNHEDMKMINMDLIQKKFMLLKYVKMKDLYY